MFPLWGKHECLDTCGNHGISGITVFKATRYTEIFDLAEETLLRFLEFFALPDPIFLGKKGTPRQKLSLS